MKPIIATALVAAMLGFGAAGAIMLIWSLITFVQLDIGAAVGRLILATIFGLISLSAIKGAAAILNEELQES